MCIHVHAYNIYSITYKHVHVHACILFLFLSTKKATGITEAVYSIYI